MIIGLHSKIIRSTKHEDTLLRLLAEVLVRDHGSGVCCDEHELHAADPLTVSLELGTRSSVLDVAVHREALLESGWTKLELRSLRKKGIIGVLHGATVEGAARRETKLTDEVRLFSGNGIERVAKSNVAAMRRPPRVLVGCHFTYEEQSVWGLRSRAEHTQSRDGSALVKARARPTVASGDQVE